MASGHAYRVGLLGNLAEKRGTFYDLETVAAEIGEYPVALGHCRSIHNQSFRRVAEARRNLIFRVGESQQRALLFQMLRKSGRGAVITRHPRPMTQIIPHKIGHANTPRPNKINLFHFLQSNRPQVNPSPIPASPTPTSPSPASPSPIFVSSQAA